MPPEESENELVKMSEFARRCGLPVPTIKHYLREGLLPEPVRTSRNMAYYDVSLIPRVQSIRELQRRLFLPLNVIKEVLDDLDRGVAPEDLAVEGGIAQFLREHVDVGAKTRAELIAQGVPEAQLDQFEAMGLLAPQGEGDGRRYTGDDIELLRLLKRARGAGLSPEMLPPSILAQYLQAIGNLVRVELSLFRAGVQPLAGDELAALSKVATDLGERLVVLLRRKMLLPTLREMGAELGEEGEGEDGDAVPSEG